MKIEKKTWPEYFSAIIDGKKTYEFRLNDFECGEGDVLVLREWNPETEEYTGRVIEKKVLRVDKIKDFSNSSFCSKEEIEKYGFQIISLGD
ncbi:DUF3850 domain-containing protein [Candidatus Pacearchaeota archaeon]|nr:DUF3850 domain-containing protein [Candidatus Pacearchaeota archaeon]